MIHGIGIDIVPQARLKDLAMRFLKFLNYVLTQNELNDCRRRINPWPHIAARFAAKEALIKALGHFVAPKEIEVSSDKYGKPHITAYGKTLKLLIKKRLLCHLSLSHDGGYSCAFVILESQTSEKFRRRK